MLSTSSTLVGDDVNPTIRKQIRKGDCIDMVDMMICNTGFLKHGEVDKSKKHLPFEIWSQCFLKFMAVFVEEKCGKKPKKVLKLVKEMLTYHNSVYELYSQGAKWFAYDYNFRQPG